jgi:hypothetical protein
VISDRDAVGCLEISVLHAAETAPERDPIAMLAPDPALLRRIDLAAGSARYGEFVEDGAAIREWYVVEGPLLLYITYSCDVENRGMDDAAVDDILSTLRIAAD